MTLRIHLISAWNGGAGRTFTAALLAFGMHLQGRRTLLIRQIHSGSLGVSDAFAATLPLPYRELRLPDPYALPSDLGAAMTSLVHAADGRFIDAVHDLALKEVGADADVVIDLCCHERSLNEATLREATVVLVPARAPLFESDWSARTLIGIRYAHRDRHLLVPTLVGTIVPEQDRAQHMSKLSGLLRDCDPDQDLLPGDPTDIMVAVPFLDDAELLALFDERPIWHDLDLQARCTAFATVVDERADAIMATILEHIEL